MIECRVIEFGKVLVFPKGSNAEDWKDVRVFDDPKSAGEYVAFLIDEAQYQ